jgi:hypothetical protein
VHRDDAGDAAFIHTRAEAGDTVVRRRVAGVGQVGGRRDGRRPLYADPVDGVVVGRVARNRARQLLDGGRRFSAAS